MKYETVSLNTKKTLAASLKKAMEKKPLPKITVSEMIADCGFNRKTFYYHFEDIYDLLKWMLEQEAIEVVKQMNLTAKYEEAILFVMDYIDENETILKNIYYSLGRDELARFFHADFIDLSRSIIEHEEQLVQISVSQDFKDFLSRFYTGAIADILLEWIIDKSTHDREKTIQYISLTFRNSIANILKEASRKGFSHYEKK